MKAKFHFTAILTCLILASVSCTSSRSLGGTWKASFNESEKERTYQTSFYLEFYPETDSVFLYMNTEDKLEKPSGTLTQDCAAAGTYTLDAGKLDLRFDKDNAVVAANFESDSLLGLLYEVGVQEIQRNAKFDDMIDPDIVENLVVVVSTDKKLLLSTSGGKSIRFTKCSLETALRDLWNSGEMKKLKKKTANEILDELLF